MSISLNLKPSATRALTVARNCFSVHWVVKPIKHCLMRTDLRIFCALYFGLLLPLHALAQWTSVGNGIDYRALTITMADGRTNNNLFIARMAVANTNCIINS